MFLFNFEMHAILYGILIIKKFWCSEYHIPTAVFSNAGNSSSSADRDYHINQGSSFPSKNQIFYQTSTMSDGGGKNASESSDGTDDVGDESGSPRLEDFEVRMDLTDDLLHMVCSA